ncbi:MAG: CehA/McbA family metallohydrolase [Anaerolineaceae bacterium]|nr:CehA/McbA family metallohydrolase [Anaerolineaceae bacterium]
MHTLPFDKPGLFYKGNLHTHSTLSDGQLAPDAICRLYAELGYDFIALTDHFMQQYNFPLADTRAFRTETFTTLLGAELHTGQTELGQLWHILAVGLPLDFPPPPPGETGPEITARALAAGAYVAVAHPAWYHLTEADILSLGADVHAIEIYNGTSHDHNDAPDSWYIMDVLTERGYRYSACATDDTHARSNRNDVGLGWVHVKSEALEPDALLAALKAGHYYSSTGPEIFDIQLEPGRKLTVRCSPAERIFIVGAGWQAQHAFGNGIREAEFDLSKFSGPYCRVIVRHTNGGRAWSNPIWF